MHRSGTTLLTRLLEQSGVFLGSKKFMNEEAVFFQHINRWLLYQANTPWDSPESFAYTNEPFMTQALKAIEWRMNSYPIKEYLGLTKAIRYRSLRNLDFAWGWKDPVNTITMDIWMRAFPNARIVNIIRNPIDVATSLKVREENRIAKYTARTVPTKREKDLVKKPAYNQSYRVLEISEGVKLALSYMDLNRSYMNKYRDQSIQLCYEKLLTSPQEELLQVLRFLGLQVPEDRLQHITAIIKPEKGYKFLDDPEMKRVFEKQQLKEQFSAYGFEQPHFLI
jgi:hypothetical protein